MSVINPLTKREIQIGSTVYNKLVKKGIISDEGGSYQMTQKPIKQVASRAIPIPRQTPQISRAYQGLRSVQNQEDLYDSQYEQISRAQSQPIPKQKTPIGFKKPPMPTNTVQVDKMKKGEQKIQNLLKSGIGAYKKTIESVNPDEFENDELTDYITHELIKNLKTSGNKHLHKYLN